ncbi:hypothetical protein N7520_011471 [Penicillium odoratum]|uniref:uncharacterized protein n=1 Tax=Penicillium odoratum TaxID=1167516 RepID=UPI002546FAB6|nr:uncharacterized protein N7520_011471 [Penicillium odoratum]KAJ5746289.1 hypothetical protein N7520_011471 [Penicillium odoratum]
MPRTLPWLLEKKDEGRVKRESTPRKRIKREADADPDLTPKPPTSPNRTDFFRSSQTPPTSPARACPTEEFLLEGLDKDDAWVMVEDEFYAIAQTFTKHLHYAEYVRRKKEAKARGAEAIKEIQRPTDGQTTIPDAVLLRKGAEALAARQQQGLARLHGPVDDLEEHSDEDDGAWTGTHLHGLMTSPRKSRSLVGSYGIKSSTRAAAGFRQAFRSDCDEGLARRSQNIPPPQAVQPKEVIDIETASEEDSDGEVYPIAIPSNTRRDSTPSRTSERPTPPARRQISSTLTKSTQKTPTMRMQRPTTTTPTPKSSKPATVFKSRVQILFDDLDELPEPSQLSSYISDKKEGAGPGDSASREASGTNNLESKSRYNDVPTFLM